MLDASVKLNKLLSEHPPVFYVYRDYLIYLLNLMPLLLSYKPTHLPRPAQTPHLLFSLACHSLSLLKATVIDISLPCHLTIIIYQRSYLCLPHLSSEQGLCYIFVLVCKQQLFGSSKCLIKTYSIPDAEPSDGLASQESE